jgi:hypothetical protein
MRARAFWRAVTADRVDLLDRFLAFLANHKIRFCLVGGQAVNAYVDPVVSLDLDIAVAAEDLPRLEHALTGDFATKRFSHSLNVIDPGSDLRIQIQTDPRYSEFVGSAETRDTLGLRLPVASVENVLQGKVWAVQDQKRRASKRQKDLADIARLIERYPDLKQQVPAEILDRLL